MKALPEELIYALMFVAVLVLQYLMKRFGPQPEPEVPPILQDELDDGFPGQTAAAAAAVSIPPADIRFGRSGAAKASIALAPRRFSRQSLLGNRRDVQNAIVIATILGPCRAYEPHDSK